MAVDGASAQAVQQTDTNAASQQWSLVPHPSGAVQIRNLATAQCLAVPDASQADGAPVYQSPCSTQTHFLWDIRENSDGYQKLVAHHSGKCLDVDGAGQADGTPLVQYTCNSDSVANQQFTIRPVASRTPPVPRSGMTASADSTETTAENGSAANAIDGDPATIWHTAYSGGIASMPHHVTLNLGGSYRVDRLDYLPRQEGGDNGIIADYQILVSADGVTWTQVASGTFSPGSALKTVTFPPTWARHVRLRTTRAANGAPYASAAEVNMYGVSEMIVGVASGRCIDVPGGVSADGTQVILWDCHGSANQIWSREADNTLRNRGKCLAASGSSAVITTCSTDLTQRWTYDGVAKTLRNQATETCLDASDGGTANGTRLILWTCHGGTNQQWSDPTI